MSEDDGATWTPLTPVGDWGGIVAMASVERLKNGDYMAFFHDDGRFFREGGKKTKSMQLYKTISKDGGLTWGEPAVLLLVGDGQPLRAGRGPVAGREAAGDAAAREQPATPLARDVLDDGAATWSEPREVPLALTGDRHTAKYAPDGRLFISFRDMAEGDPWKGDWVAWVGTYDDIVRAATGSTTSG